MKVVVATDGSIFGKHASIKFLDVIGLKKGDEVVVISVVQPITPSAADGFGVALDYSQHATESMTEYATAVVEEAVTNISERIADLGWDGVVVTSRVLFSQSPKGAIVEETKMEEADLLVVGTHGHGFLNRLILGSVSNYVVQKADCSVLVVKLRKMISGS